MPLYTYACDDHGEFSDWRSMGESDAPQPCPSCREPAPRALARPAIGGRTDAGGEAGYGAGACAAEMPKTGGHVCGGGCAH